MSASKEAIRFGASWVAGILTGGVGGAAIGLVFDMLEGTPYSVDGFSSSQVHAAWLGAYYGAILGAVITPFAYPYIRKIGICKAVWPALISVLLGGLLGIFLCPLLILPLSILFLFGALDQAVAKSSQS